jgi:hypothetical protein
MPAPIEEGYNQVLLKYLLKRQLLYWLRLFFDKADAFGCICELKFKDINSGVEVVNI